MSHMILPEVSGVPQLPLPLADRNRTRMSLLLMISTLNPDFQISGSEFPSQVCDVVPKLFPVLGRHPWLLLVQLVLDTSLLTPVPLSGLTSWIAVPHLHRVLRLERWDYA